MNLPNYFLADLPSEATLSAAMITEACQALKRNRERYLAGRSTLRLVKLLSEIAENWLQPDYPFRKLALDRGTIATGFSRPTLGTGLDSFFSRLTGENLHALLDQELGHANRLDELIATSAEQKVQRAALARGPELIAHITAGNVPNPALASIVLGILTRSGQFVKCARGSASIPCLFAHSIYEADPKLGACLEIVEWSGGNHNLENALFAEADCVTATGNDETLSAIRLRLTAGTRFLGYGHRISFGYVTHRALSGFSTRKIVAHAARDIVAWNQLGCLSPHVIYVEHGGGISPEQFAEMLAEELARREELEPRGALPIEVAAAIASRRGFYEVRAAHSRDTRHWFSQNSTAWSVIFENDPRFQTSCLHRFIYIKGVSNLTEALQGADSVRGRVSTVGLAATEDQATELANQLARWGATRICPLGEMQNPPLSWRHDGRPSLGDLVTWTDWER